MDLSEFGPEALCIVLPASALITWAMINATMNSGSRRNRGSGNSTSVQDEDVPNYSGLRATINPLSSDALIKEKIDEMICGDIPAAKVSKAGKDYWDSAPHIMRSQMNNENALGSGCLNTLTVGGYGLFRNWQLNRIERAAVQMKRVTNDGTIGREKRSNFLVDIGIATGIAGIGTYFLYSLLEQYLP